MSVIRIAISSRADDLPVHAYWRLDARLAYTLPWYKTAELYIAGQNLAISTHQEYADNLIFRGPIKAALRQVGGSHENISDIQPLSFGSGRRDSVPESMR